MGKDDEYVMLSGYFCSYYVIDSLSSPQRLLNTHPNCTAGWDPRICFTQKLYKRVKGKIKMVCMTDISGLSVVN